MSHHHNDLGYGEAKPDSAAVDHGYEQAEPDSVDYGYGYEQAEPDYGYEDATPDTGKYGYEQAAPDDQPDYGYGTAEPDQPDYGYEDAKPDAPVDYGYGDAKPDDPVDYGYGDAAPNDTNDVEYSVGLNDDNEHHRKPFRRRTPGRTASNESMASVATADSYGEYDAGERRQRYRRRGSVTKYSIEAQQEVSKVEEEFTAHSNIIDQFRNQCAVDASVRTAPAATTSLPSTVDQSYNSGISNLSSNDSDVMSGDHNNYVVADTPAVVGSLKPQENHGTVSPLQDGMAKKKKKGRFKNLRRRFSIR